MEILGEKFGTINVHELSKEKLDFLEIITVFTAIHRGNHFGARLYDYCIETDTYYNLLCRLEEIKKEIEKEIEKEN